MRAQTCRQSRLTTEHAEAQSGEGHSLPPRPAQLTEQVYRGQLPPVLSRRSASEGGLVSVIWAFGLPSCRPAGGRQGFRICFGFRASCLGFSCGRPCGRAPPAVQSPWHNSGRGTSFPTPGGSRYARHAQGSAGETKTWVTSLRLPSLLRGSQGA